MAMAAEKPVQGRYCDLDRASSLVSINAVLRMTSGRSRARGSLQGDAVTTACVSLEELEGHIDALPAPGLSSRRERHCLFRPAGCTDRCCGRSGKTACADGS